MPGYLKQSTAVEVPIGPFVDAADGVTPETTLTISQADVRLKKEGGDWAQKNETTAAAHEENGNYRCLLDATDTNTLGRLRLHVNESGALPVWEEYTVLAANVYDSLIGGGDLLQIDAQQHLGTAYATPTVAGVPEVDVTHWLGTAAATPTVAGVPEVDVTHLGGGAQSAADLKDFADDGYDPSTNKVQGVVLVDTLTTYTGNTPQTGDSFARIGAAGAGLSAVPWNAAWDAEVQSEVADALDAAIPGSPTANSINERIQTMDNAYTATRAGYLDNLNGHVPQTGDSFARLGAPAGASHAADLAAVKAETAAILDDTGTSGVVVAAGSKSGYSLAASGLDSITATDPGGVASTFPQMVVQLWRRFFKKATLTSTQVKTYADDGSTVRTTQTVSDDGTTQTQGAAS